mmetsp:Transcript_23121/g.34229  ORF Transcript_23121/g.34229 Transcript_23121/m.34229 type:complete len:87 (+) Transcript_23121:53-313(+)
MSHLTSSDAISPLIDAIKEGDAICVSDGSYFPLEKVSAAAWIISTENESSWIEGGGVIPGPVDEQNSYRSKLGGLVGIATGLNCLK